MSNHKFTILVALFACLVLLLPHGLYENLAMAGLGLTVIGAAFEAFGGHQEE